MSFSENSVTWPFSPSESYFILSTPLFAGVPWAVEKNVHLKEEYTIDIYGTWPTMSLCISSYSFQIEATMTKVEEASVYGSRHKYSGDSFNSIIKQKQ